MAWSNTSVPTHATGDYLNASDWNLVSAILNGGPSNYATQGTYASTGSNGSAPFYVWFGVFDTTTNSSSELILTIPNSGFPNGLLYVSAEPTLNNASGTSQQGHSVQADYANCSKTQITLLCSTQSGSNLGSSVSVRYNLIAIGY